MEANWINRLVLNDRVSVRGIHTEVQLVRGRITALIGVNRVGLIVGVDRRCATDGTARDAHTSRERWFGFPRNRWRRVQCDINWVVCHQLDTFMAIVTNRTELMIHSSTRSKENRVAGNDRILVNVIGVV